MAQIVGVGNKFKKMKHTKGKLITGDFNEKTMTFEIEEDFTLQVGNYFLIREEDYKAPEMYDALKEIKIISKRLNLWIGIDNIIDPLLKEIES
jgi:hypothetical protein